MDEVIDYYDDGMDFEIFKAEILISKLGEALGGSKAKRRRRRVKSDKPDIKGFDRTYGDKIIKKKKK